MNVVVKRQRPLLTVLMVLLVVAVVTAAGLHFWDAERERFDRTALELGKARQELARENMRLKIENEALTRRIAVVERSAEVEARAYEQVGADLRKLQAELQTMKEEVSFYQGILSNGKRRGVRVQKLLVQPAGAVDRYMLRMVLTRGAEDDTVLTGSVRVAVDGNEGGEQRRLGHAEIVEDGEQPFEFSFRHFQRIERALRLPDDFEPRAIRITIEARDAKGRSDENVHRFDWPSPQG